MNVIEQTKIGYELHHSGIIYTMTITELVDETGKVVSVARPIRAAYEPAMRYQKSDNAPVTIVENDLSAHPDQTLQKLASIWWTPEIRAASRAAHQTALDASIAAAKKRGATVGKAK